MNHSFSVSELQTVCSVHVANDPFQVVSVYYVRDRGVVSVKVLDSQLPKHLTLCQQMWDSVILRLTEWAEGLYRAVKFAKIMGRLGVYRRVIFSFLCCKIYFIFSHDVQSFRRGLGERSIKFFKRS